MPHFLPFDRDQLLASSPAVKAWLAQDELARVVIDAAEQAPMDTFQMSNRLRDKSPYHPRLKLALLIYSYVNGIFGSRRIEQASQALMGLPTR